MPDASQTNPDSSRPAPLAESTRFDPLRCDLMRSHPLTTRAQASNIPTLRLPSRGNVDYLPPNESTVKASSNWFLSPFCRSSSDIRRVLRQIFPTLLFFAAFLTRGALAQETIPGISVYDMVH